MHRRQRHGREAYHPPYQARGSLTTEDGPRPGMLLEYGSPRYGIANNHGILLVGYLTRPHGGPACMETHAYLQSLCAGAPPCTLFSKQLPLQAQGGQHGALCMIFLRHRGAKNQQDTIAADRTEHASIPLCLRMRQLIQRMEPALPGLQTSVFTLHGRSHQGTTQNRHHFPLTNGEHVIHRQGNGGLRLVYRIEGIG
jgi:hypothetical protein